jgi:PhnB protein
MSKVKSIPAGYHTVTPYIIIKNADEAIQFYKKAFNAKEVFRLSRPDGKVGHAEIRIGDSPLMICEEILSMNAKGPETLGGSPIMLHIYVDNVDALYQQALEAGAIETKPLQNQFYGDRSGMLQDPFGHSWSVATRVEDVAPDELERRFTAMFA